MPNASQLSVVQTILQHDPPLSSLADCLALLSPNEDIRDSLATAPPPIVDSHTRSGSPPLKSKPNASRPLTMAEPLDFLLPGKVFDGTQTFVPATVKDACTGADLAVPLSEKHTAPWLIRLFVTKVDWANGLIHGVLGELDAFTKGLTTPDA
jgi:hypothetical protein